MGSIKRLPEAIRSSIRSGVILYDFARVVEELVFNSLDARATKVCVAVGVGSCYVKVDDNGFGVSRDGLVLIGERYATSKYCHLDDMQTFPASFGFKGEALSSISDVSLLEIVSKTHGRPNGYIKILKDGKCLYLGIDDVRQDVGTTVIVRDLFYNQPVRRKQMRSSPKKVLHSVRDCLLRIALVHPDVSFKLVDTESEDDLLSTHASPSPLPLLSTGFDIQASSSLNKLNASDGSLKISGYISGPKDAYPVKVLQYFYVNSRFVSKGPMHKLLNNLAMSFDSASDIDKRSRTLTYPLFLLNLNCPRSFYDLTLEPSKTSVEFKDWRTVLFFIENAVMNLWAECNSSDMPANFEFRKKRCRSGSCKLLVEVQSPPRKKLNEDCTIRREIECFPKARCLSASENIDPESRFFCQTESSNQLTDGSLAQFDVGSNWKSETYLQPSSLNIFSMGDDFLDNKSSSYKSEPLLDLGWENDSPIVAGRSTVDASFRESLELDDSLKVTDDRRKPFMQHCSLKRSLAHDGASFASDEDIKFESNGYSAKQDLFEDDDNVEFEVEDVNHVLNECSPRGEGTYFTNFSRCQTQSNALHQPKFLSQDSEESSLTMDLLDEDNHLLDFVEQSGNYGSNQLPFHSDLSPLLPDPLLGSRFQHVDDYNAENGMEGSIKHGVGVTYNYRNMKDDLLIPAINNLRKEDCLLADSAEFDLQSYACAGEDHFRVGAHDPKDFYSSGPSKFFYEGDDQSHVCFHGEENLDDWLKTRAMPSSKSRVDGDSCNWIEAGNQCKANDLVRKSRSHSAPPFYQVKKKFFPAGDSSRKGSANNNLMTVHDVPLIPETRAMRKQPQKAEVCGELPQQSFHQYDHSYPPTCGDRPNVKMKLVDDGNNKLLSLGEDCTSTHCLKSKEEPASREAQHFLDSGTKWRSYCPETTRGTGAEDLKHHDTILNITSGILHFVGDSLVPDTIGKSCLDGAKVLQQVDKKFIPIVAGKILAIIDQHAADERIRLEELRDKVLSGQMRTTTYLESEQELVMPEIGYQLLHNYAEQIRNWGWICSIHSQASRSFSRNLKLIHKQPTSGTLLAVPCILGVNLTDVDLLEFLQQLADTDGSSIMPPSVNRILNNKACRSAIMFGDALLPSECSLIVEELKKTSLCFQCAHGRPTTVPLVNMDALHEQIAKLGSLNRGPSEAWHGFYRHEISLERAEKRLRSAVS